MTLSEKDALYNWHPYTQHKTAKEHPVIVRGEGSILWDENGKEYIDAIASWWVNPYGHSNRFLADSIYKQLVTLEHVLFGGFTHPKVIELSEKLATLLPVNQRKFFYSDNGSTAVEVAIKAAVQFFHNREEKRTKIIAFENAFHGDTFGAMAASGISFFTKAFEGSLIEVTRIPLPYKENTNEICTLYEEMLKTKEYAAFIFEPLIQGAAGMVMYDAEGLDRLMEISKKYNVLTIADEVMTGFGKTGRFFACDYLSQLPDMMCLSKALTGGTVPMAVTSFTNEIFDAFYSDDTSKALFHGHTFTANPTGCAAALASISLMESEEMKKNIQRINEQHLIFKERISKHFKVDSVRVLGVILALDIKVDESQSYYGDLRNKMYDFFISRGIVLRPVGNVVYILPPYVITNKMLNKVYEEIENVLEIL